MTVKELIEKLEAIEDKDLRVFVWDGLDAGCMIDEFKVTVVDEAPGVDKCVCLD